MLSQVLNNRTFTFENSLDFARQQDQADELHRYRDQFLYPTQKNGTPYIYFCGNSLGLQPKITKDFIDSELEAWQKLAVEGHFVGKRPWIPYHEYLAEPMAKVVGAKPSEVVVMNTLTVNLHLMMVSFYQPTQERHKILIEADAFSSDQFGVVSQIKFHGYDPETSLIALKPRAGEATLRQEDIDDIIEKEGNQIALILFGNPNYYTGQVFDLQRITELGHQKGCYVGFDCAHGAGNIPLNLHDSGADFAIWCTYKYMNAGPGSMSGCFVHERHNYDLELPRFTGWWGHNKAERFNMRDDFDPIPGAEGWQLSNTPILSMAAIRASLQLFDEVSMEQLRAKSLKLTGFLEYLIHEIGDERIEIITPSSPDERGCQLSIQVRGADKRLFDSMMEMGVIGDWREPNVIRLAPTPFYNSFEEVFRCAEVLRESLLKGEK
ncbi:MAG: kynureninase [Bacteroidota bacterium]